MHFFINRTKLDYVSYNYVVSEHAQLRMVERDFEFNRDIKKSIQNALVGWKSPVDNHIIIAFNSYNYIVVDMSKEKPVIVTFGTTKFKNTTIVEKMFIDYKELLNRRDKTNGKN